MLNPADCKKGKENYEKYSTVLGGRLKVTRVQYDYRHTTGKLFTCVGKTIDECRLKRDKWLENKQEQS